MIEVAYVKIANIMTDVLLAALTLGPLLVSLVLKSNAALGFLALSAGSVVVTYGGNDISSLIKQIGLGPYSTSAVELVLLIIPLAVTLLLTRKSVAKRSKYYFQAVAALCTGGLLALAAIPLLSNTMQTSFSASDIWINLQKVQASVVGVGALCSLFLIWFGGLKHSKHKKH
ncbi:hypothetical protein COU91_01380 [Candidatus Saccharibacteria bacterium CG10_big_fil_rev_8_21_14_0_10_47_8]|nr:MAG: hypothetical protein COU91_01380 [Candidatus Saccharibacteria bacterium CG10_big_fil_rev_8_21_14_0_10_47_8]